MENIITNSKLSNNNNASTKLAEHSLSTNDGLLSPMERPHNIDSSKTNLNQNKKSLFLTLKLSKTCHTKSYLLFCSLLIVLCLSSQVSFIKKPQNLIKFNITNINDYFHNEE